MGSSTGSAPFLAAVQARWLKLPWLLLTVVRQAGKHYLGDRGRDQANAIVLPITGKCAVEVNGTSLRHPQDHWLGTGSSVN